MSSVRLTEIVATEPLTLIVIPSPAFNVVAFVDAPSTVIPFHVALNPSDVTVSGTACSALFAASLTDNVTLYPYV